MKKERRREGERQRDRETRVAEKQRDRERNFPEPGSRLSQVPAVLPDFRFCKLPHVLLKISLHLLWLLCIEQPE